MPVNDYTTALKNAFEEQIYLWVRTAGILGFKANWDHFNDPKKPNVLDLDPEEYLCEREVRRLPSFREAQRVIDRIFPLIPEEHFAAIMEYYIYLQTDAPKIAHYRGFLLADQILPHIVPRYKKDEAYTAGYRQFLIDWCGTDFS